MHAHLKLEHPQPEHRAVGWITAFCSMRSNDLIPAHKRPRSVEPYQAAAVRSLLQSPPSFTTRVTACQCSLCICNLTCAFLMTRLVPLRFCHQMQELVARNPRCQQPPNFMCSASTCSGTCPYSNDYKRNTHVSYLMFLSDDHGQTQLS